MPARLFLDFIISRAGQEMFREANYIPMHPDVPAKSPEVKAEQGGYKSLDAEPGGDRHQCPALG